MNVTERQSRAGVMVVSRWDHRDTKVTYFHEFGLDSATEQGYAAVF
jgi:hypothetical protein